MAFAPVRSSCPGLRAAASTRPGRSPTSSYVVERDRPGCLAEDERARHEQLGVGVGVVGRVGRTLGDGDVAGRPHEPTELRHGDRVRRPSRSRRRTPRGPALLGVEVLGAHPERPAGNPRHLVYSADLPLSRLGAWLLVVSDPRHLCSGPYSQHGVLGPASASVRLRARGRLGLAADVDGGVVSEAPRGVFVCWENSDWPLFALLWRHGALAQLGERRLCKPEVTGSIPVRSTWQCGGCASVARKTRVTSSTRPELVGHTCRTSRGQLSARADQH